MCVCVADVGGFVQDPDPELLVRWYQAGALQPFFRGHSAKVTKRREPWLFGVEVTSAIRSAVQDRYCLLPYWYTLFHQAHMSALPPIRYCILNCSTTLFTMAYTCMYSDTVFYVSLQTSLGRVSQRFKHVCCGEPVHDW